MTTQPIAVTLVGATGLTGASTLRSLLSSSVPFGIHTLTRRPLDRTVPEGQGSPATVYENTVYPDLQEANKGVGKQGGVFVSCLGTTRAGGLEAQKKVDVDLGVKLASAAKEEGATTCIVVSSAGTSPNSYLPYSRMKGELEEALKALDFDALVILRPAMLLGKRESSTHGLEERLAQRVFRGLRSWHVPVGSLCVDADDVGACIAHYAVHPPADKVTVVSNSEIISIAKAWRDETAKPL